MTLTVENPQALSAVEDSFEDFEDTPWDLVRARLRWVKQLEWIGWTDKADAIFEAGKIATKLYSPKPRQTIRRRQNYGAELEEIKTAKKEQMQKRARTRHQTGDFDYVF